MRSIDEYIHDFTKLRRAPNLGGAPHKPILLLSVIDAIEKGFITSERIFVTAELIALFKSNWKIWVKTPHTMNFTLPFYHLANESFWQLVTKEGSPIPLTSKKSIKSFQALIETVNYALIDKDLFLYLNKQINRTILKNVIIKRYFPDVIPIATSDTSYLDIIAEQILRESAIQYKKTIEQLQKENEDTFEEEVYIRNNVFKQKVPQIYDYTCSVTGLKIQSNYRHSLIDACHIIPFHLEHDDTIGNGIALCPNLHRAFDNGLITINTDYRIVVSQHFSENNLSTHSIHQFDSKKLILPCNKLFYPRKEALQWHNENVFERNL